MPLLLNITKNLNNIKWNRFYLAFQETTIFKTIKSIDKIQRGRKYILLGGVKNLVMTVTV